MHLSRNEVCDYLCTVIQKKILIASTEQEQVGLCESNNQLILVILRDLHGVCEV
jgi:hypothetical protein